MTKPSVPQPPMMHLNDRCPLCENPLHGMVIAKGKGIPVVVIDCTACGRYRLPEPALAVLEFTHVATRLHFGILLQMRRNAGETQVIDLTAVGFVETDSITPDLTET